MTRRLSLVVVLILAGVASDCAKPFEPRVDADLRIETDWTAPAQARISTTVSVPLRVRVTDAEGRPVAGQLVQFTVTRGLGVLAVPDSITGPDGGAGAGPWFLGYLSGTQEVTAHLPRSTSDSRAYFRITTTP